MFHYKLLSNFRFDDDQHTLANRYFWCYSILDIPNQSIRAVTETCKSNFTDDVWAGQHPTLWPVSDDNPRYQQYRSNILALKSLFEAEIIKLQSILDKNNRRQRDILGLREELFSGTSIQETHKMHKQGQNIWMLTLVSIFFLPLSFVASVFGMTNMPIAKHYWMFGIVLAAVCIPFFTLIIITDRPGWVQPGLRLFEAMADATV
jgi:hypothetical protein